MESVDLKIRRLTESARMPVRGTPHATGLDLFADLNEPMVLNTAPQLVPTGIAIELPAGCDAQVRPRSGLSSRGVAVAFGTIDPDYRGEIMVTMWTFGALESHAIAPGDRIAQLVVARVIPLNIVETTQLSASERGAGGHGSTGR